MNVSGRTLGFFFFYICFLRRDEVSPHHSLHPTPVTLMLCVLVAYNFLCRVVSKSRHKWTLCVSLATAPRHGNTKGMSRTSYDGKTSCYIALPCIYQGKNIQRCNVHVLCLPGSKYLSIPEGGSIVY